MKVRGAREIAIIQETYGDLRNIRCRMHNGH